MKRPFVPLCIFLSLGIIGAYFIDYSLSTFWLTIIIIISILNFLWTKSISIWLILTNILILGFFLYQQALYGNPLSELLMSEDKIDLVVQVLSIKDKGKAITEYDVNILSLRFEDTEKTVKITDKAILQVYNPIVVYPPIKPKTFLLAEKSKLEVYLNGRDLRGYENYLKSKGINSVFQVKGDNITVLSAVKNPQILSEIAYETKQYVEDFLDSTMDFEKSSLLKSILFGNQGYLDKDQLEYFSKTGTAHIIAVSGLHVGLLTIILIRILKLMKVHHNYSCLVSLVFLFLYGAVTDFPVSIIRAGVMYFLFVMAYFLERRYDGINALFCLAFTILLFRPFVLFSISFQLSFGATLSILIFYPLLKRNFKNPFCTEIFNLMMITVAAQLGTLPIMLYHFKQFFIVSLFSNLMIVPFLGITMMVALIAIFVSFLSFPVGTIVNQISSTLIDYIYWTVKLWSRVSYGSFEVEQITIFHCILYYICIIILYVLIGKKEKVKQMIAGRTYGL